MASLGSRPGAGPSPEEEKANRDDRGFICRSAHSSQQHRHAFNFVTDLNQLAAALTAMGCPAAKSAEMAWQLDKRAKQLARQKGKTYQQAMTHLLALMREGWAAKEKGL